MNIVVVRFQRISMKNSVMKEDGSGLGGGRLKWQGAEVKVVRGLAELAATGQLP